MIVGGIPLLFGEAAAPLAITYAASNIQVCNPSTTFSGFNIGTASSGRYVVVTVSTGSSAATAISSITVAGQSCTVVTSVKNGGSNGSFTAIAITNAPVTSGTTADIAVTMNSNAQALSIGTFAVTGLASTTPTATATTTTNNGTMTVVVPAKGGIIAVSGSSGYFGTGGAASWTGITQRYFIDGYATVHGHYVSGASNISVGGATFNVSCNITDNYQPASVTAAFF